MKVLFITHHFGCLRNFDSAIAALADRGHAVHLAAIQREAQGGEELVRRLAERRDSVTYGWTPSVELHRFRTAQERFRLGLDYLRYLDETYAGAPRLRARAWERAPRGLLWLLRVPGASRQAARRVLAAGLRAVERALPIETGIRSFLDGHAPDIVLFTPLIGLGSPEVEYLSAARRMGLRTLFAVWSWDNLSSKSLLRDMPDAVTVWNDTQKREAIDLHNVPPDRVLVTGAQCFDRWFGRQPTRTRQAFCTDMGLPADRPFVLYVCSALFRGSPSEAAFVRRWINAVRSNPSADLRDMPILVRPHPSRLGEWDGAGVDEIPAVRLWGSNPVTAEARDDYFDSLYWANAVVGLNTSAMIEAAILERPVLTILLPEFQESQEGTLHFRYLLDATHGLLHASHSLEEHVGQLAAVLASRENAVARSRAFVSHFVRPLGLDVSGTSRFVDVVERVACAHAEAADSPPARLAVLTARVLMASSGRWPVTSLLRGPREQDEHARRQAELAENRRQEIRRLVGRRWRKAVSLPSRFIGERRLKAERRRERAARRREKRRRLATARHQRLRAAITARLRRVVGARQPIEPASRGGPS
ncbi:MAG: hypothetical protein AB1806_18190 [Acidobacteriota bacterium]